MYYFKEYWINQKISLAGKTNFTHLSIYHLI